MDVLYLVKEFKINFMVEVDLLFNPYLGAFLVLSYQAEASDLSFRVEAFLDLS